MYNVQTLAGRPGGQRIISSHLSSLLSSPLLSSLLISSLLSHLSSLRNCNDHRQGRRSVSLALLLQTVTSLALPPSRFLEITGSERNCLTSNTGIDGGSLQKLSEIGVHVANAGIPFIRMAPHVFKGEILLQSDVEISCMSQISGELVERPERLEVT